MFTAFSTDLFAPMMASPELEVIAHEPKRPVIETPLLFIHGAFAGAWCWDEYFLPYLAARGFRVHALSLRGHGNSEGHAHLHRAGLRDYVADVRRVVQSLPVPPILIGHSMGGMVVQKYLERYAVPATVLMASVPPTGLAGPTMQLMIGDPWLFTQISMVQGVSPSLLDFRHARRALFSDDVPEEQLLRYMDQFQPESQRAIWDMTVADLPRRQLMHEAPMLVMGADNDGLFAPSAVHSTASFYDVEAQIFPHMNHAMMLERRWQEAADYLAEWLLQLPTG